MSLLWLTRTQTHEQGLFSFFCVDLFIAFKSVLPRTILRFFFFIFLGQYKVAFAAVGVKLQTQNA
jgi:hypothetical protein